MGKRLTKLFLTNDLLGQVRKAIPADYFVELQSIRPVWIVQDITMIVFSALGVGTTTGNPPQTEMEIT